MAESKPSGAPFLQPATTYARRDEAAYALSEINLPTPDFKGKHRYQIIYVQRGDKLAEFRRDLGPRERFGSAPELRIPSFWVHSVAELVDMAEELRDPSYWTEGETPLLSAKDSTILEQYASKKDNHRLAQRGRYTIK